VMARKYVWTKEKYKSVVGGNRRENIVGLRSIVKGFDKKDGFDLNKGDKWTLAQQRRVREYCRRVEQLAAQPKRIVRARGENLKKLQDAFHGDVPSSKFKVAFVPDTEPKLSMPGAKQVKPKIRVLKEGISIKRKQ